MDNLQMMREQTSMTKQDALTNKGYWDDIYSSIKRAGPGRRCRTIAAALKRNIVYYHLDKVFRKHLPAEAGFKFIEFGCGGSFWMPYFSVQFRYNVEGVDYSESGCKCAEKQLRRFSAEGNVVHCDFTQLGEGFVNKYDVCGSFGVIEHFANPSEIIAGFCRTLKREGIMITVIPNLTGLQGKMQAKINREVYQMHNTISLDKLRSLHEDIGMKIIYSSRTGALTFGMVFPEKAGILSKVYLLYCRVFARTLIFLERVSGGAIKPLRVSSFVVIATKVN